MNHFFPVSCNSWSLYFKVNVLQMVALALIKLSGLMVQQLCSSEIIQEKHKKTLRNVKKDQNWWTCLESRDSTAASLLQAEGRYAPKSDRIPLRQSQNWESPYLFINHEINNNILLWTKTLSVSPCLPVFFLLRSPAPSPPVPLAFVFRCLDSYLNLCCSLHLPVCSYSHSQRLAVSFLLNEL